LVEKAIEERTETKDKNPETGALLKTNEIRGYE